MERDKSVHSSLCLLLWAELALGFQTRGRGGTVPSRAAVVASLASTTRIPYWVVVISVQEPYQLGAA